MQWLCDILHCVLRVRERATTHGGPLATLLLLFEQLAQLSVICHHIKSCFVALSVDKLVIKHSWHDGHHHHIVHASSVQLPTIQTVV
jgi:hypothetical protein